MGRLSDIGWKRLGVLIDEHGEDGALHMICDSVACGMSLSEVCKNEGMPYSVLWRWLKGDGERMAAYEDALDARADAEAHKMIEISDNASIDDVQVAGLKVKARQWVVERWGRKRYGNRDEKGGSGITVVLNRGLRADVDGGVLTISADGRKGYQDVEVVGDDLPELSGGGSGG